MCCLDGYGRLEADSRGMIVPRLPMPTIVLHPSQHSSSRAGAAIAAIVLHHTGGTDSLAYLTENPDRVSTHFLIAKDGTRYRMVDDDKAAHTVGHANLGRFLADSPRNPNLCTLNIELENLGTGSDPYPEAQLRACGEQIAVWWAAYGPLPVLTHKLIDTRGKIDPAGLDLLQVLRYALEPAPPARYTADSPILAPAGAALPTVILRFPTPATGYTRSDVRAIISAYYRICAPVGVDPVLAIAQMAHETGSLSSWWAQRPRRNPAGIGVDGSTRPGTDSQPQPAEVWHRDAAVWRRGNVFSSWEGASIPAHVGRLLAYALPEGAATPEQTELIAVALAVRPLPVGLRGTAPTLRGLNGRWAPGAGYADAVAARANKLVG